MDGPPQEEADFSSLPVLDRITHKNWKARVSAYNELAHTFKTSIAEDAPEFNPYLRDPSILAAALKDANAVAQEQGIICACAFVEYGGKPAASSAKEAFTSAIVEKNIFGTSRAGSKKAIVELCLLIVECDNSADTVCEACIEGLKSKQPKAVAGAVLTMKEIVRQFGAKTVNVKPILKTVNTIFSHADKGVRAEGTQLVQELHRWLGSALDPHLADLKPVQQKELTESFAGEEKATQSRFTRVQQRERALRDAEATLTANQGEQMTAEDVQQHEELESEAIDAYDLAEPQAILNKLPEGFYTHLASPKWKDRKEMALDPLLETLRRSPRIQDANYDELVRALAGRMTDANIACVISAAGCIEYLAKGLRQDFARYKSAAMPPILERCKEKKVSVTDALGAALDSILLSVSISDVVEDVATFAKHKNPQVKEQTYRFLIRGLSTTKVAPNVKTDLKPLADALLSGMDDGFAPVRDAAAETLGTLLKVVGERAMGAILDGLDEIKRKKVLEFASKAEVRCKALPGQGGPVTTTSTGRARAPAAPKVAVPRMPLRDSLLSPGGSDKENSRPGSALKVTVNASVSSKVAPPAISAPVTRRPPVLSSAKKPMQTTSAVSASNKSGVPAKAAQTVAQTASTPETLKYKYTQEDAEAQANGLLPAAILSELGDPAWKLRLAAMEGLQTWIESEGKSIEGELVVRVLSKTPGWKESNFQVYSKMAALFAFMAANVPSWTRACSALTIGPLSDKLGDIKIKKSAGDALTAYAEAFSLLFVLNHAYDAMTKQKAPKSQSESLNWIDQALRDFGVLGLAVRDLVEFLKNGLKSSNAAVRTSATKVLVTLRLFVGPDIKTFVQDLNPTLLTTIETEFDKVAAETPPQPTRQSADNVQTASNLSSKGSKAQADPMDDLFPRQDIAKLINAATIKSMGDANWKQRKEALESVQGVLVANTRLKPNLGELGNALKMRLPDSNKVVQGLALDVIARLANGMNKPFERFAKMFIPAMCGILADAKASVRAPALSALDAICDQCGLECMLQQVASAIEVANPVQRSEVATWIGARLKNENHEGDFRPLISPIIGCLEDKAADVRKAAQGLLPSIISNTGYALVLEKASSLKPASRSVILPVLENARASLAQSGASSTLAHPRAASAASESAPSSDRATGAACLASRPLPAVTRSLKVQNVISTSSSRASTPVSRPSSSSHSQVIAGTPKSRRPVASAQSRAAVPAASHSVPAMQADPLFLFRTSDESGKHARAAREVGPLKWVIEGTARSDQIDFLQQQALPHISQDLASRMFSRDHNSDRDHAAAVAMLAEAAAAAGYGDGDIVPSAQEEARKQLLANSDLILKYITIRFCDTSSSIHLNCLDLVENLFQVMLLASYHLSDYEAASFLPSLMTKLGDSKETIRTRTRSIVRSLGSIYPSSKVFTQLLDQASRAKSARVRSESIEEVGNLIQRHGLGVCQPSKALPELAALLGDRDAASRSAALDALAQAYGQIGNEVFSYVGELAPKEQTLLEERLKRTAKVEAPDGQTLPQATTGTPIRPGSRQSMSGPGNRPGTGRVATASATASRLPAAAAVGRRTSALPASLGSSLRGPTHATGSTGSTVSVPAAAYSHSTLGMMMDEALPRPSDRSMSIDTHDPFAPIGSRNIVESVDALKRVQKTIVENAQSLETQASVLIDAISSQMAYAFEGLNQDTPQAVLRLCKHLMQTLSGFFDNKKLSLAVTKASLATLLAELTKRLLETADSGASEAIVSLSKVLNMVLIRIFHNSDNSACFGSLFLILERVTLNLRDLQGEELASRAKYAELVMKCLWKISKSVRDNLGDGSLDAKKLLLDIDRFLQAIPPAEWRRRASDNIPLADMPLRTVKTILQQVVGTYGDAVYDQLTLLDRAENSFVYQYLYRLLNNSRAASASESTPRSVRASGNSTQLGSTSYKKEQDREGNHPQVGSPRGSAVPHSSSVAMSPTRSNDIQMNLALKDIFDMIGNAQESKKGIAELYEFKKQHPEAEVRINTWIAATGSFFQSYLKRALSNLASEEADRQAAHSTPSSPTASRPVSYFPSAPSSPRITTAEHSPSGKNRNSSPRVSSSAMTAGDERLDSLKQMFGVSRVNAAR